VSTLGVEYETLLQRGITVTVADIEYGKFGAYDEYSALVTIRVAADQPYLDQGMPTVAADAGVQRRLATIGLAPGDRVRYTMWNGQTLIGTVNSVDVNGNVLVTLENGAVSSFGPGELVKV